MPLFPLLCLVSFVREVFAEFDLVNPGHDSRMTVLRPCGSKTIAKMSPVRPARTNCAQNHGLGGSRKSSMQSNGRPPEAADTMVRGWPHGQVLVTFIPPSQLVFFVAFLFQAFSDI